MNFRRLIAFFALFIGTHQTALAQNIDIPSIDQDVAAEEDESDTEDVLTFALIDTGAVISLDEETRLQMFGAYSPRFDLTIFNADVVTDVTDKVTIGATYVGLWRFDGVDEHTARAQMTYSEKSGPWVFEARVIVAYRLGIDGVDERWRLRPRARVKYQNDFSGTPYVLYVSAEPTYNFNTNNVSQVGYAVGGYVRVTGPIWANAFYQRTQVDGGADLDIPAIGLFAVF